MSGKSWPQWRQCCIVVPCLLTSAVWFRAEAVLRYPDGAFESRTPLHVDECGQIGEARRGCLLRLRQNVLEDADCNRVICDQIHTSAPIEEYADARDWVPFKSLCGNMQDLFLALFDLGMAQLDAQTSPQDVSVSKQLFAAFHSSALPWLENQEADGALSFGNTTLSVLRWHFWKAMALADEGLSSSAEDLLQRAVQMARRLQLLIENVSVSLLLNFYLGRLKVDGDAVGEDLLGDMYGDSQLVTTQFHEIPGKRWDTLGYLLEHLGVSEHRVVMAEVGVEAANTSQRLLERNPNLSYLGVDPYVDNDGLYNDVVQRLGPFASAGRFALERRTSGEAALLVPEGSLDLVFLDARHDYQAVWHDVVAWHRKVRPGGILSGHDFSWMFPPVAMAIYKAAFSTPERVIHLAPDGVWWFQF